MASSGTTGSGDPDMILVGELLEEMQRRPPAIAASKLLAEHYISCGWLDAAKDIIQDLKRHAPNDAEVTGLAAIVERRPDTPVPEHSLGSSKIKPSPIPVAARKPVQKKVTHPIPQLDGNLDSSRKNLTDGYTSLRSKAKILIGDLLRLQSLQQKHSFPQSKNTARIQAIVDGGKADTSNLTGPPGSARGVARTIQANPGKAIEVAIADLEDTMRWIRAPQGRASGANDDAIRDALVKRVQALDSALPEDLKIHCELALMHVVHENLDKSYVNDETMGLESVKDIPRENFYVTEDNYAWDMDELVGCITANGGVMRNPLSRQMFTPKDVRGMLIHPLGKSLEAQIVQQDKMSKGVRLATIEHMEKLAKILLEDQSSDQLTSRHAIDEFLAYVATLPELEQKALDGFRCPAKDSHTGNPYDLSIGEAVRDAKGNLICFHKTGDFIRQAASYLHQNRGAPPTDSDKCVVM